jgi:hypothetical protein
MKMKKFNLFIHKLIHWEYWPYQVVYLPVYFQYFYYVTRTRSFFFFNASNPAHCSIDADYCPGGAPCCVTSPCSASAPRCNGAALERCSSSETEWEALDTCPTRELCQAGLAACAVGLPCTCEQAACNPGDTRCTGARLERCAASQADWETVDECETPQLCALGRSAGGLDCQPAACAPGESFCTETGVLQTCRDDRTGFRDVQTCDGPPFCDVVAGSCTAAPCAAGFLRCNGAQIEVCRQDRSGFDAVGAACESADLCVDDSQADVHCDDPACDAGDFRCLANGQPQRCNAGLTDFENAGPACRPDLCSEVRERCDFCVPNRQE